MESPPKEVLRDLIEGKFDWVRVKQIMSSPKDSDRFSKYLALAQERVRWKDKILPPYGEQQYSFDDATKSVSAKNAGNSPIQFQNHTELKPSKDGKDTDIHYTGVSSSTGPIMGFEPTEAMRTQFALSAFMRQMHNVGMYIEKGGK